ncbi:MAG: hypothetical protein KIT56_01890 [Gammaproteobacteria bacterium]|nr:hypothetical protein [Gammaproteobacteria bacterium]MCW5582635.1 hypothetical protein [Gammaproteobacteria bacterium]
MKGRFTKKYRELEESKQLSQSAKEHSLFPPSKEDDQNFKKALKYVAYGKLEKAKALLKNNPQLALQSGNVVTRAGLTVKNTTLLGCAVGAGDPEMIAMIMPYFSQAKGDEDKKETQLEECRLSIENMLEQEPYDLTELFETIKESSEEDVTEALNKNFSHKSNLSTALANFRKAVKPPRSVSGANLHYNYQTLIHALRLFYREWENLKSREYNDACDLIFRQVIGYLQRGLPAVDRFFVAGNGCLSSKGKIILACRSLEYRYEAGSVFPDTIMNDSDHKGIGFDCAVYEVGVPSGLAVRGKEVSKFEQFVQEKFEKLKKLALSLQQRSSDKCVIS